MLNYRHIKIVKTIASTYLALCSVTAGSTVPNNHSAAVMTRQQVNNPAATLGDLIVRTATLQMEIPYKFGSNSPSEGFDCSGLAVYSHLSNGISIPR
jgi:cell wall-associated NlpC family hydrolase